MSRLHLESRLRRDPSVCAGAAPTAASGWRSAVGRRAHGVRVFPRSCRAAAEEAGQSMSNNDTRTGEAWRAEWYNWWWAAGNAEALDVRTLPWVFAFCARIGREEGAWRLLGLSRIASMYVWRVASVPKTGSWAWRVFAGVSTLTQVDRLQKAPDADIGHVPIRNTRRSDHPAHPLFLSPRWGLDALERFLLLHSTSRWRASGRAALHVTVLLTTFVTSRPESGPKGLRLWRSNAGFGFGQGKARKVCRFA
jgi:hypothetical protein